MPYVSNWEPLIRETRSPLLLDAELALKLVEDLIELTHLVAVLKDHSSFVVPEESAFLTLADSAHICLPC